MSLFWAGSQFLAPAAQTQSHPSAELAMGQAMALEPSSGFSSRIACNKLANVAIHQTNLLIGRGSRTIGIFSRIVVETWFFTKHHVLHLHRLPRGETTMTPLTWASDPVDNPSPLQSWENRSSEKKTRSNHIGQNLTSENTNETVWSSEAKITPTYGIYRCIPANNITLPYHSLAYRRNIHCAAADTFTAGSILAAARDPSYETIWASIWASILGCKQMVIAYRQNNDDNNVPARLRPVVKE